MSKPKVLVTRADVPEEGINMLKETCEVEIYDQTKPISKKELLKLIPGKDALFCLLTDSIDKDVIAAAGSQLKAIATMSVGYDHIDLNECKARNIFVSNTPDVSTDSVAEWTVTLMLAAGRNLIDAARAIANGEWIYSWSPLWLCGQGLKDSVVGIVGMGRIGQAVMKRVLPFGVKTVLYFDMFHPIKPGTWNVRTLHRDYSLDVLMQEFQRYNLDILGLQETRWTGKAEELGAVYTEFEELVKNSDFIVSMCNLSEETKDLFCKKSFDLMKPNAVFINTSRGGVVNQKDLYAALKSKKIRAAGLDVTLPEPLPKDHELITLSNIIITPHVGSAEVKVRIAMAKMASENILNVLGGKPMSTPVPLPK